MKHLLSSLALTCSLINCATEEALVDDRDLTVTISWDDSAPRRDNAGSPSEVPEGHAAQSPRFEKMSVHMIELVPDALTPVGKGAVIYKGAEVAADNPNPNNFKTAVDFAAATVVERNAAATQIQLSEIPPGTYKHVRVSVTYQMYDVDFDLVNVPQTGTLADQSGTIASFLGYNMFIKDYELRSKNITVDDFKLQGYWGFETNLSAPYDQFNSVASGQSEATTVVNPFPQSPVPAGSCIVAGSLAEPLVVDQQTPASTMALVFSINNSFEWVDKNHNGRWDVDAQVPTASEPVVDMGIRGLDATIKRD